MNACFCCVGFSFSRTKPKGWLRERLPNDLLLCRVRRKTLLTHSLRLHKAPYGFIIEFEVYDVSFQACLS